MDPYYVTPDDRVTVHHGDCLDVLRTLPDASVDSVVTDPPYSLTFMGKSWDSHDDHEDSGFGYWLAGFIDGEGCFLVKGHSRGTYAPSFQIKVRRDDRAALVAAQRFVGAGQVADVDGGESNPQARWVIQDRDGCQRLVDVLDKYPLRAKKRLDYLSWREAVCEWTDRPRGNRWHGAADQSRMEALRARTADVKGYVEPAWSGNDFQDWCRLWAAECLRVLKPGGHMVAFGGTRTYHRLTCAIEDAGFEVRDSLMWIYAQGFPKSRNLDGDWAGWGTALKPAHEPIVLARKPLVGTVAGNVLAYGTGALNIDGTRVASDTPNPSIARRKGATNHLDGGAGKAADHYAQGRMVSRQSPEAYSADRPGEQAGRWPANVVLSHMDGCRQVGTVDDSRPANRPKSGFDGREWTESYEPGPGQPLTWTQVAVWECVDGCPVAELDAQSGITRDGSSGPRSRGFGDQYVGGSTGNPQPPTGYGGEGGASRFFPQFGPPFRYEAKANSSERPEVRNDDGTVERHATVKPVDLMRWLVRLVTPPGGVTLDPFAGSGTTGEAAWLEGFGCVLVEREADYLPLIVARLTRQVDPVTHAAVTADPDADPDLLTLLWEEQS